MSVLAPLYFLGALAIGLPILFHLIRRQPRGQVNFSSLMFLQPTPPRLTRRSRLDNWPLLLIRALALMLLIAAFARPFLRSVTSSDSDAIIRRIVLVIDTSASMRRADLWENAMKRADEVITDLSAGDQLSIVAFDQKPKTVLSFEQSEGFGNEQLKAAAKASIADLAPSWMATDLGRALAYAADMASTYEPKDTVEKDQEVATGGAAHIILISDVQEGSRVESLQTYAWPDNLQLDIRHLKVQKRTNAFAKILAKTPPSGDGENEAGKADKVRVRVENTPASDQSKFRLVWMAEDGKQVSELPIQVPPGQSRVLRMPAPATNVTSLALMDDDFNFDNKRYLVSPQPESQTLLYLGDPAKADIESQRESLFYYLQRVPLDTARRKVTAVSVQPSELEKPPSPSDTPLIVVGQAIEADVVDRLRQFVEAGGQVLFVVGRPEETSLAPAISSLTGQEITIEDAKVKDYAMLSRIDFAHPLFGSMSDPQFNDFTKIHFWAHRKIDFGESEDWKVLSYFDDGDPALLEYRVGKGKVWTLASGWQPSQSQLALSTKFIPLVFTFFDANSVTGTAADDFTLGEPMDLTFSESAKLSGPESINVNLKSDSDLDVIDRPGIYHLVDGENVRSFAVNMDIAESRTSQMKDDALERFGIGLGKTQSVAELTANQRQLRDIELEKRQKIWQWLLVAALLLLGLETFLGGLMSRVRTSEAPVAS